MVLNTKYLVNEWMIRSKVIRNSKDKERQSPLFFYLTE